MADTLLLDPATWDLVADANGNIAVASAPYALAQDASSEIRTFLGEVWYNTRQGVPYWQHILGHIPPLSLVKNAFVKAAKRTPDVIAARCFIATTNDRKITGQVQILDKFNRVISAAEFR